MIATFCLRLALGMLGALFLLPARQMHPRFFRTHFLTVLGMCLVAAVLNWATSLGIAAALLGTAMTAMLVGHSYLISPGLSINPLMRPLYALGMAIVFRAAVAG